MPGIFGLLCSPSAGDVASTLAAMADRMRHEPWYREDLHVDPLAGLALGRISLGVVDPEGQPARNEDGSLLAVMDGEVYDAGRWRRELSADHRFRTDSQAELLLHGYESRGRDFFRGLEGKFVAAIWDSPSRRLLITCDRFGMRPLYYVQRPGKLLMASEIKALLADPTVPRKIDVRGLAQFFTYAQLLGEDTLLEGIRLLPAAGWLEYDGLSDRLSVDRYWRLGADGGTDTASATPELLDRIVDAFRRSVDRCTAGPHRLGLSLSSGLDSRTILAAIGRDRLPIPTVTLGVEGSSDHCGSRRLAELAGCPNHPVVLDADFLSRFDEHLSRMVHLTDGQYYSDCITQPTLPVYRDLGIDVLIRGHAGELMHMHKAYSFSAGRETLEIRDEAGLEDWLLRHLRSTMIRPSSAPLFAPAYDDEIELLSRASLRDALSESAGVGPPLHRICHLFVNQRSRRETALSLVEFGSVVEPRLPFLDNELVAALLAAPPEWKLSEKIQASILRRCRPEFLGVMNANTGAHVGVGRLGRLLGRVRLKVFSKLRVRGYRHYERMGHWLRTDLRPMLDDLLLSDRTTDRGFFNPVTLRNVVRQHLEGRSNNTFLIVALMIFEKGQREFLDGEGPPVGTTVRTEHHAEIS